MQRQLRVALPSPFGWVVKVRDHECIFDYSRKATIHKSERGRLLTSNGANIMYFTNKVLVRLPRPTSYACSRSYQSWQVESYWTLLFRPLHSMDYFPRICPSSTHAFCSPHPPSPTSSSFSPSKLSCPMTTARLRRAVRVCSVGSASHLQVLSQAHIAFVSLPKLSVALHMGCGMQPMAPAHTALPLFLGYGRYFFELYLFICSDALCRNSLESSCRVALGGNTQTQQFPVFPLLMVHLPPHSLNPTLFSKVSLSKEIYL
jgi:hypothetical protein